MSKYRVYTCIVDEAMTEIEVDDNNNPIYPDEFHFSVYKTESGKEIAICPNCKSIIEFVCQEVINKQKKGK